MRRRGWTTLFLIALALGLVPMDAALASEPLAFYVNYSARVPTAPLVAHPLSIVHPSATVDLEAAHRVGNTVLAYISVGEVASDAPYRAEITRRGLPLAGRNAVWKSDLIDLTDPRWAEFLVGELATAAVARGFDGFFLDTLDSIELIAPGDAARQAALKKGLVETVRRLRAAFPKKRIVVNRGFAAFPELRDSIDGVLAESLFATHDFATKTNRAVAPAETEALLVELRKIAAAGRAVYVLDYADPAPAAATNAMTVASRISALGYHAFVSTPALDGAALAPLRPVARRICSFYGNLSTVQTEQVRWPAESFTAQKLQLPLEWLGYEVDYFKLTSSADLPALDGEYRAIVLPRGWQFPMSVEGALVDWLMAQRRAGRKILIMGALPFRDPEQRARFIAAFGLSGSGAAAIRPRELKVVAKDDAVFDHEATLPITPVAFTELRAPANARRILTLESQPKEGPPLVIDPAFTCDWGGVALDPFLFFRRADTREFWRIDPFAFLERALGDYGAPAPDTTTRDGRRMLMSHIDGDGFSNFSGVEPGQRSAEIVRDRILKKYPLPVTVSIIEAELRGLIRTQRAEDSAVLETIARSIFALPQIELASHSFSHPFFWIEGDREEVYYDQQILDLKSPYVKLDLEREIAGSVRYINETLAPPDRKVRVFLWTGNCRPPPAAIAIARRLGLENVNGGDTIISPRNQTLTTVAPRSVPWGDELQVFAPNQNENVYTNNWRGPHFGTFSQVIDTFTLTEKPRRLKPVNIYYHFYGADYPASLRALETIHDWAVAQPLHAVTLSHYARIARDARHTTLFAAGVDRWIIVNRGESRTVRLPTALAARIDLARSTGVTGWIEEGANAFIHTDGSPVVTLTLGASPALAPRLESSSGEIAFRQRDPTQWKFAVSDVRPVTVALAGFRAGTSVRVTVNGAARAVAADGTGRLQLTLPDRAEVELLMSAP